MGFTKNMMIEVDELEEQREEILEQFGIDSKEDCDPEDEAWKLLDDIDKRLAKIEKAARVFNEETSNLKDAKGDEFLVELARSRLKAEAVLDE